MLNIFRKWSRRYLFEEESVLLLVLLAISLLLLMTIGDILAPIIASLILAFLMQGMAASLERRGLPHWIGVLVAFSVFMGVSIGAIFIILPLVWRQLVSLIGEVPRMLERVMSLVNVLPEKYPAVVTPQQINDVYGVLQSELASTGQTLVTFSLSTIPNILGIMVYLVLVPILVFFLLKDRDQILEWASRFLPPERPLLAQIWGEMNLQVANYARGKVLEIMVVGVVSYISFGLMGLNYAALLALLVGLSVIIPYIGAMLVTFPVLLVGFFQWGVGTEFYTLFAVYLVIQALDGNVLVPLLFSEAVNLHPVAIILAVLFFGGIWGTWGVFFAIPLATLIKAIISAWPTPQQGLPPPDTVDLAE